MSALGWLLNLGFAAGGDPGARFEAQVAGSLTTAAELPTEFIASIGGSLAVTASMPITFESAVTGNLIVAGKLTTFFVASVSGNLDLTANLFTAPTEFVASVEGTLEITSSMPITFEAAVLGNLAASTSITTAIRFKVDVGGALELFSVLRVVLLTPLPSSSYDPLVVIHNVPHLEDTETYEAILDVHEAIDAINTAIGETVGGMEGAIGTLATLSEAEHSSGVKTTSFTVLLTDGTLLLDGSTATVVATLPFAYTAIGRSFRFKCINATNGVSIKSQGGETLEGGTSSYALALLQSVTIQSDGVNWWAVGT